MNFTREPIIETIISPKDGYKLCIKNSKGSSTEEYFVDAVEVVSFGHAFFFRCLEMPKAFLVPATDYEILEVRETRVALKNVSHERNIKIGGGRDASVRRLREAPLEKTEETSEETGPQAPSEETGAEVVVESRRDRKRDRRRHRRRRGEEERRPGGEWAEKERPQEMVEEAKTEEQPLEEGGGAKDETKVSSSMFSTLFPPPPTLISETISRYKDKEVFEGSFFSKPVENKSSEEKEEPTSNEDSAEGGIFSSSTEEDEDFPISSGLFTPPGAEPQEDDPLST